LEQYRKKERKVAESQNVAESPKSLSSASVVIETEENQEDEKEVMEISDSESLDEGGIFTVPASILWPLSRRIFHFVNYKENDWTRGLKRLLCKLIEVNL
jgi:hypothetical protein